MIVDRSMFTAEEWDEVFECMSVDIVPESWWDGDSDWYTFEATREQIVDTADECTSKAGRVLDGVYGGEAVGNLEWARTLIGAALVLHGFLKKEEQTA